MVSNRPEEIVRLYNVFIDAAADHVGAASCGELLSAAMSFARAMIRGSFAVVKEPADRDQLVKNVQRGLDTLHLEVVGQASTTVTH